MSGVSSWILSITGVILLSVIIEIVLPEGQMNKYIKGVMSFIIIFTIVSPIPNIIGSSKNYSLETSYEKIDVQQSFIDKIADDKCEAIENNIFLKFNEIGYENFGIKVENDAELYYLTIDLSNLVINDNSSNKDISKIKDEMEKEVKEMFSNMEVLFNG